MKTFSNMKRIEIVDSHTGGEPTRFVLTGAPSIPRVSMAEAVQLLRSNYDDVRRAIILEPRGSDVHVGAYFYPSNDPRCLGGVIFFNNVGYLGMCGHGTIGVATTLAYLGKIDPGPYFLETPVGIIRFTLAVDQLVSIMNVPSYRYAKGVSIEVPGFGKVVGDIAWGGNWFFLVDLKNRTLYPTEIPELIDFTSSIRSELALRQITGADGAEIDHIELFCHSPSEGIDSRNFVLCPGKVFDRSPCGTGTSAKLACLYADHLISEGQTWRQESIIGSVFEGKIQIQAGELIPEISGYAHVHAESKLLFQENDPFNTGIDLM